MRYFRWLALVSCLLLVSLVGACGTRTEHATDTDQVPAGVDAGDANQLPQEIHQLPIVITNGAFDYDVYETQPGAVQLTIKTVGGPYTMTIPTLVAPQALPANGDAKISFTAPNPGQYSLEVSGAATGHAVLDVRPPGGK